MRLSNLLMVVVIAFVALPTVHGYQVGWISFEGSALALLASIAISVAYIAGREMERATAQEGLEDG